MIPSLHLDLPEQEAAKEFASARKKALLRRIGTFLRRRPSSNRLLSFDEATEGLGPWRQAYLGRRTVPVKSIVGSEGRYADFDDEFLPLQGSSEEKWRSVYAALRRGEELPPVSLLKVGDAYFVRDGNHRVSVARWLGIAALDADVAEVRAVVPIETATFWSAAGACVHTWIRRTGRLPQMANEATDQRRRVVGGGDRACP
jgi:hypothetical protein